LVVRVRNRRLVIYSGKYLAGILQDYTINKGLGEGKQTEKKEYF